MEITEGGERQAGVEWHENEYGRKEGIEGWTRKGGWGSRMLQPQSGFHSASHQQPRLRKHLCVITWKASFDSNRRSAFWHHTKTGFVHSVATGELLKKKYRKPKKVSCNYNLNESHEQPEYWRLSSPRDKRRILMISSSFVLQEIKGTLTKRHLNKDGQKRQTATRKCKLPCW